jgi:hypothetical protein
MRNLLAAVKRRGLKGDGGVVALLALVCLAFFLPSFLTPGALIWPSSGLGSDMTIRHWPDFFNYVASWRSGRLALWDSSVVAGRPLAGDPGVLFMYPLDVIFLFLPEATAFNVLDAIHVFLAGLFMFLFLRVGYTTRRPAALLGGLAFAFAPKYMAHLAGGHINIVCGLAWAPAVLLGLRQAFKGSLLAAALAGLALALQLPTHIQIPYYTAVIASAFWVWHLAPPVWQSAHGDPAARKRVGWLVLVYLVWLVAFVLLAAVVLFPFLELLPYNSRADFSLADANLYALPPFLLAALLMPPSFQFPEWTVFLGVIPLGMGLWGWFHSRSNAKWFFGSLVCFALIYALGQSTPLFGLAFWLIPGFRLLRTPTRLWFFGGLAMAVLAGLGADTLADEKVREKLRRGKAWLWRGAGLYVMGLSTVFVGYLVFLHQWYVLPALQAVTVALVAGLGYAWLSGRLSGRRLQWALIPLVLLDLWPVAAAHITLVLPAEEFLRSKPALDFVASQAGVFRVYSPSADLSYGLAAQRHVELLDGMLAFQIKPSVAAIDAAAGCDKTTYATAIPPCIYDKTPPLRPDAEKLGQLNVRYLVSQTPPASPGFKLVLADKVSVYENLLWQPRVQVLPAGTAEIVSRSPGSYDLRVHADGPAQLIVSETWLPGWQLTDNGRPAPLQRQAGVLISATLAPGEHVLHLEYLPLGWRIGWPVSLASILGLAAWCGWASLKKHRAQTAAGRGEPPGPAK